MFAVIETGGKQYLVKQGSIIQVEKLEAEKGERVEINKIIYVNSGTAANATVSAEVVEQCKGTKVIIFKKKRRKNYRRKTGHRQSLTVLRVNEINLK